MKNSRVQFHRLVNKLSSNDTCVLDVHGFNLTITAKAWYTIMITCSISKGEALQGSM